MKKLTMVIAAGMFVIGRKEKWTLNEPRQFHMMNSPEGRQIAMSPLPGLPDSVILGEVGLSYEVTDSEIENLYLKATTGIEMPPSGLQIVKH